MKKYCPKFSHKFDFQKWPKTVKATQQIGQSCQKTNLKKTNNMSKHICYQNNFTRWQNKCDKQHYCWFSSSMHKYLYLLYTSQGKKTTKICSQNFTNGLQGSILPILRHNAQIVRLLCLMGLVQTNFF